MLCVIVILSSDSLPSLPEHLTLTQILHRTEKRKQPGSAKPLRSATSCRAHRASKPSTSPPEWCQVWRQWTGCTGL